MTASDTASILPIALEIGISAINKPYNGTTSAFTTAHVVSGLLTTDIKTVTVSSSNGIFSSEDAGNGIWVTADVEAIGTHADNYTFNVTATDTASILPIGLVIGINADNKPYD